MEKNFKKYLEVFIKIVLVVCIAIFSYGFLKKVYRNREVAQGEFKNLPENSLDVLVLGSSQAQYSFSPGLFYKDTGLYSYVMGSACQQPEVSYLMLKEVLKTQKPKMLILEIFTFLPLRETCLDDSCYVIASYMMTGQERLDTLSYLENGKAEQYHADFINLHNNWRTYTKEDYDIVLDEIKNGIKKDKFEDFYFGYVYQENEFPQNWWFAQSYEKNEDVELLPRHQEALDNIYNLCQENDIDLLLYKVPMDALDQENYNYMYKVFEWADDHDIKYIDYVKKAQLLQFKMNIHSDSFHSNIAGAGMLTNDLATYIRNNYYDFEHVSSEYLDDLYSRGACGLMPYYLRHEYNPAQYLKLLDTYEGFVIFRYKGTSKRLDTDLYEGMKNTGLGDFDTNESFIAIIKNGELVYKVPDHYEDDFLGNYIVINNDSIVINNEQQDNSNAPLAMCYINKEGGFVVKSIEYRDYVGDYGITPYY